MIERVAVFCKKMWDWFKSDRCFVRYFAEAFSLSNNLLLLTIVLLSIFITFLYMVLSAQLSINPKLSLIVIILLSSALASGFFYTIKTFVDTKDNKEKIDKSDFKFAIETFCAGIGEHYLSFVCMFVMFFILAGALILGTFIIADNFICSLDRLGLDASTIFITLSDPSQIVNITQNMLPEQQEHLKYWYRAFLISTQTFTFLIMLWIPEVLYTKRNFFTAFFTSIGKIFSDFPRALCVYLTVVFLNYILALLIVIFSNFSVMSFLLNLVSLYLLVFNFFAIFVYYRKMFVNERGWIA